MVCIKNICHFSLNKELVAIRVTYFLMLGALGTLNPFLIVFMKVLRMSSLEISIIFGISTFLAAPFRLIIGYFADKTEKRSSFFFIASFLTGLVTHLIFYIPINETITPLNISSDVNWTLCFNSKQQYTLKTDDTVISIQDDQLNRPDTISETRINCLNKGSPKNSFIIETSFFLNTNTNHTNIFNVIQLKGFVDMKLNSELFKHCQVYPICNFSHLHSGTFSKTFIYSFLLVSLCLFTFGPLQNILDSLIYTHLHKKKDMSNFGRSRLFGTIGYGFFALISGFVMDLLRKHGYSERNTYFFNFFSYAIIITLSGVNLILFVKNKVIPPDSISLTKLDISPHSRKNEEVVNHIPNGEYSGNYKDGVVKMVEVDGDGNNHIIKENGVVDTTTVSNKEKQLILSKTDNPLDSDHTFKDSTHHNNSPISWKDFFRISSQFYMLVLMLSCLVAGTLSGCNEGFFFYFLDSLDPNNKLVMGLSLALSSFGEIIVLFFSGKVMQTIGRKNCLYLVFIVYALRYFANSFITDVWFGVFTEFSQAICFGLFYPIVTEWASSLTPLALQSTIQCYIGAVYFSLGRATGLGIGGVLYNSLGPRLLFRVFACVSTLYTLCLFSLLKGVDVCRKKRMLTKEVTL